MIEPGRFIARSSDRELWLFARSQGVTATMVAKAATRSGFDEVVASLDNPQSFEPNEFMRWGIEREPIVSLIVKDRFGIMPNDWLIAKDTDVNRWQMATPDGLSTDHKWIAEIKTTGKPFDRGVPLNYMRQIQWQLWVTGAERAIFAWEERLSGPDGFAPGLDVTCQWVDRDEKMMKQLVTVAERLQEHQVYSDWIS